MTAVMLLAVVLVSSLPCEFPAELEVADARSFATLATSFDAPAAPEAPSGTDLCVCLCMGCPGAAVEGVATSPRVSAAGILIPSSSIPPDETHTSDVLSRLFRPPRSA